MNRYFHRNWKVSCWQETIPNDPTKFNVRRASVDLLEITELRVQFKVTRSLTRNPNQADVIITNLAERSRAEVEQRPLAVQVEAGYDGASSLVFVGDVRFSMSEIKGADWETLLQLGDDDCHHRWARVSRSYRRGTTYREVLVDCARSFGYALPPQLARDSALDRQFVAGTVSHGPARDELTRLLSPFGYDWSIQNGQLQILSADQVSATDAIEISEDDSAMIGTPQFGSPPRSGKPPHMTVKMLLKPELSPGSRVHVTSKIGAKSGFFRAEKVEHHGDSHGEGENSWTTTAELKPL